MATNEAGLESGKKNKQEGNREQSSPSEEQRDFNECLTTLLNSVTEFGAEVSYNRLFWGLIRSMILLYGETRVWKSFTFSIR